MGCDGHRYKYTASKSLITVWLEIIPPIVWQSARNAGVVEEASLSRFVCSRSWLVVQNCQIEGF